MTFNEKAFLEKYELVRDETKEWFWANQLPSIGEMPLQEALTAAAEFHLKFDAAQAAIRAKHGITEEEIRKFIRGGEKEEVKVKVKKAKPKELTPLDYGFVRFTKDGKGKWVASLSQALPKSDETLCFAVHVEMYSEPVFEKDAIKDIVDWLNSGHISEIELELRGRRSLFRMDYGTTIDLWFDKGHLPGVKELVERKGDEETLKEIRKGTAFEEYVRNGRYAYRRAEPEYTEEQRDKDIQRAIRHNGAIRKSKTTA